MDLENCVVGQAMLVEGGFVLAIMMFAGFPMVMGRSYASD